MSDKEKDSGITDAAAETAAKSPAPAKTEKQKDEAKAATAKESTPEQDAARGDAQAAEFQKQIDALRAELAAATAQQAQPQYAQPFMNTVDANRARVLMVAQSEAEARASNPGEVPGGPKFEIPMLDPQTGEVKGYRTMNGRGEKVDK